MAQMTPRISRKEALRRLSEAALPYGLGVVATPHSPLPDIVLSGPDPDGREVARIRYFEPVDVGPHLRSIFPHEVTRAEQARVERHITERIEPVILAIFSPLLWYSLPDGRAGRT